MSSQAAPTTAPSTDAMEEMPLGEVQRAHSQPENIVQDLIADVTVHEGNNSAHSCESSSRVSSIHTIEHNPVATSPNSDGATEHHVVAAHVNQPTGSEPISNTTRLSLNGDTEQNSEPTLASQGPGKVARADDLAAQTTKTRRSPSWWLGAKENWTWETISIFWAILCLIANTIILLYMSGKSLNSWQFVIGPNTIIGIFSTLSKAALVTAVAECISQLKWLHFQESSKPLMDMQKFDTASRGPYGSLVFVSVLWSKSGSKSATWALLGCIITIVALAFSPFTQQIISFRERMVRDEKGFASLAVARAYDNGNTSLNIFYGLWSEEFTDHKMQGALIAGAFSQQVDNAAFETCSSSNCTWPMASSLSICSSCQNVTARSSIVCSDLSSTEDMACTYTTPHNISLEIHTGPGPGAQFFYTMLNVSTMTNLNLTGIDIKPGDEIEGLLVNIGLVQYHPVGKGSLPNGGHVEECQLYWCKTTYSPVAKISNSSRFTYFTQEKLFYDPNIPVHQGMKSYFSVSDEQGKKYLINVIDHLGLVEIASKLFTTSLASQRSWGRGVDSSGASFGIGSLLHRSENVSSVFNSIAMSLTAQLRSGRNSTQIEGQAWIPETYIHVQWAWLALPIVLVVMTLILLSATILMNRRDGGWLWRSNILPYLFIGRRWGVDEKGTSRGVSSMEDLGRSAMVCNAEFKKNVISGESDHA